MSDDRAEAGWKVWGFWILASVLGWASGLAAGLVVAPVAAFPFAYTSGFGAVFAASVGVMVGSVLGVYQWSILQRRISRPGRWILASALGGAVGWLAVELADLGGGAVVAADFFIALTVFDGSRFGFKVGVMTGAVVGASMGVAQWLVLWQRLGRAGWWILGSVVGWAAGWTLAWWVGGIGISVVPGVLGGAITGAVLVWLLRKDNRDGDGDQTPPAASEEGE